MVSWVYRYTALRCVCSCVPSILNPPTDPLHYCVEIGGTVVTMVVAGCRWDVCAHLSEFFGRMTLFLAVFTLGDSNSYNIIIFNKMVVHIRSTLNNQPSDDCRVCGHCL